MSWDAFLFRSATPERINDEDVREPLGSTAEVFALLAPAMPGLIPGNEDHPGAWLGFDIWAVPKRGTSQVHSISLSVHGGTDPVPTLVELARTLGLALYDEQVGELIDLDAPRSSWQRWVAFASGPRGQ